jgi:hypothetical protein
MSDGDSGGATVDYNGVKDALTDLYSLGDDEHWSLEPTAYHVAAAEYLVTA